MCKQYELVAPGDPVEVRAAELAAMVIQREPWTMTHAESDGFKDVPSRHIRTDGYLAGRLARIIVDTP